MTNIITKQVNFFGDEIIAVQDNTTKEIFASISHVLRGIGFNEKQIEYQRGKWQEDRAIEKGTRKFFAPSGRGTQEAICISLKKLPLALAKINITPLVTGKGQTYFIKRYAKEARRWGT